MTRFLAPVGFLLVVSALAPALVPAQSPPPPDTAPLPEDFKVYGDHPRLFLNVRRLRLVRRERERESMRWEQFQALVQGKAALPEKGFALALYYQATENAAYGKEAVAWALGPVSDLRQIALVFDWCQPVLTDSQSRLLIAKLQRGIDQSVRDASIPAVRSRALAAIALADHVPGRTERELRAIVVDWWRGRIAPTLKKGRAAAPREQSYALMELLHAVRDNTNIEMREDAIDFFKDLPAYQLLTYYPARYPGPENDYRIAVYAGVGEPDLEEAALARAADLSLVAYDSNALECQFLQGWLIQDKFLMRGVFGAPYEFLWANPYQPGLSYYHMPLSHHDRHSGILLARSSWEEDATWLGYFKGQMELFMDGKRSGLQPRALTEPLAIGEAIVMVGEASMRFTLNLEKPTIYYILGLKPNKSYEIEVTDEEMFDDKTDAGGILELKFPPSAGVNVIVRESKYP